jgi:hypothetical protein
MGCPVILALARRVAGPEDLEHPGDYCGPLPELEGPDLTPSGRTAVLVVPDGPGIARLASPPWRFAEQPDGTIAIASATQEEAQP